MYSGNWLSLDGKLIFIEKCVRTVPYGFLGVLYGVYMKQLGFGDFSIGLVLMATVLSSALYTFAVSFVADRLGRVRTLIFFAFMDFVAGSILFLSAYWWAPILAGIVGNMTVGAGEVGPFLSLEQAILPRTCDPKRRTLVFSFYNLIGYGASSIGALMAGLPAYLGGTLTAYRPLFLGYLVSGLLGGLLYSRLSRNVEMDPSARGQKRPVLSARSRPIVMRLSALFAVDSFGGGFIGQSIIGLYFYERYQLQLGTLGLILSATQIVTAISFLLAERIARRIGLLRTMVLSHIPSNVFLTAIPFAPSVTSAVALLLCRHSLSQMDVPTRQSYVMAVVEESDRTPAAGFTNVSRTVASSVSPSLAGYVMDSVWLGLPFVAAGTLKLIYDFAVYAVFRKTKPTEEHPR